PGAIAQARAHRDHFLLDGFGELLHFPRAAVGSFRQRAYFIRHHSEAAPVLTSTGGFNRRIQREQVGLVGDAADHAGDLSDVARTTVEFFDEQHRFGLALRAAFNGPDRTGYLAGGL